jgi:hypothetical protein
MRIVGDVKAEQHKAVRLDDVLEPQSFGTGLQAAAHRNTVQQDAQRSIEAARPAILNIAVLVAEALEPPVDSGVTPPVRFQCPQKLCTVE